MATLSVRETLVSEGSSYADVVVTLSAAATSRVTVNYATADWTAYAGAGYDYLPATGTLTFNAGETSKTVRVTLTYPGVENANYVEGPERFKLVLSSPSNATLAGDGFGWVYLRDNDSATANPELVVSDLVVDEAAGSAIFTVSLGRVYGQSSTGTVTVKYATVDGSAKAGSDYTATSGTLSFAPGESVRTVTVPLLNDTLAEDGESFRLQLSDASTGVIVRGSASALIGANDAAPVSQPRIRIGDVTVSEGDVYADVVVTLSAPSANTVTVAYGTANWTAYAGDGYDFRDVKGTLTFAPGETTQVVRFDLSYFGVENANYAEGLERFKVVLSAPTNATLAGEGFAWVNIVDNDTATNNPEIWIADRVVDESAGQVSFVVTLGRLYGQSATGAVSVSYATQDGTARAGSDYAATSGTLTFLPGESAKTVTVPLLNDSEAESAESFRLLLSNATTGVIVRDAATATLGANDATAVSQPKISIGDITVGEGDAYAELVVSLSAPGSNTVTVSYGTADWTAYDGDGYDYRDVKGTLTFYPGETTKVLRFDLSYAGVENINYSEGLERFKVVLSAPSNATLVGEGYAWVTVVDNDTAVNNPELWVGDLVVDEAAGFASFTVQLGRLYGQTASGPVSVDYTTQDGTALAGSDYAATSGTLTFLPGESVKTVRVPLLNDSTAEGAEAFRLLLSNPSTGIVIRDAATATLGANDATPLSQPKIMVGDLTVGEGDIFAEVVVSLSAPGVNPVTVNYATADWTAYDGDGYDFRQVQGTLTFAPGETTKVVRIDLSYTGVQNANYAEDVERFKFVLGAPTNATLAGEGQAWITVVDNDTAVNNPELWVGDLVVDEAAGFASFTVRMGRVNGQSATGTVTVDYATQDGTALAGSDYTATSGTLTFLPGESVKTVKVPLINDSAAEEAEAFRLVLANPSTGVIVRDSALATLGANDAAPLSQPKVQIGNLTVGEGEVFAEVVVSLSAPGTSTVTVAYATADWTAYDGSGYDFSAVQGTLTFNPGETTKVLRIDLSYTGVQNANYAEALERFKVVLSSPTNATLAGDGIGWVTVVDNDTTVDTPSVWVHDSFVSERDGYANFVVTLGRSLGESARSAVTVDFRTADGTAKAGSDYLPTSGTLTFLPGETAKTVSVKLVGDALVEPGESFRLELSNPGTGVLADAHGAAFLWSDDAKRPQQPTVAAAGAMAMEEDGYLDMPVTLSWPSDRTVTVKYATQNGTATTSDYTAISGTLTFLPGETMKVVRIDLRSDNLVEAAETFKLVLSAPTNALVSNEGGQALIVPAMAGDARVQVGGAGDDTYTVTAASDMIFELPIVGGRDTVFASLDYTLPDYVDNLVLAHPTVLNGTGNAQDNSFVGNAANNRIDGKGGIDTMVYGGASAAYTLSGNSSQRTVSGPGAGTDTLVSIERLRFADTLIVNDTTPGGNTYKTAAILQAAFNAVPMAELSRWTAELDRLEGDSVALVQQIINYYAPGATNEMVVAHVWGMVVGAPIGASDLATYAGLIDNGTYSQAQLVDLAASLVYNTAELASLVGSTLYLDPSFFPLPASAP